MLPEDRYRLEEGYVIQKGFDSPRRVKLLRKRDSESNLDSEQEDEASQYEVNIQKNAPLQQTRIFNNQIVGDMLHDRNLTLNVTKVKPVQKSSPLKEEVAKKFVGIIEDLGVYNFNKDDFRTQDELVEKLDFVRNSIKQMKGNIRELA